MSPYLWKIPTVSPFLELMKLWLMETEKLAQVLTVSKKQSWNSDIGPTHKYHFFPPRALPTWNTQRMSKDPII